ncbi:unnamed protein product [Phytophthora fragariaefolia]|uniref:Unnamed protein product n=1 Tax=Phytophthora fragariaefolia TaxID=1490495 RepID=A0A9W6XRE9_9STRA|nr:unnamed protein product [Phytophthora fragariaefolia]
MQRMFSITRVKHIGNSERNQSKGKDKSAPPSSAPSVDEISLPSPVAAWGPVDNTFEPPPAPPPSPASQSSSSTQSTRSRRPDLKIDSQLDPQPASFMSPSSSPSSSPTSPRRHTGGLANHLKHLVSKEKRRFSSDGFDLDLTYVTRKLVALGYPAEKIEGIYRNHYRDVFRFFEQRHPGRYRVYNLCVERRYAPDEKFHGRVAEFGFEDHTPPPLSMMLSFCRDVHIWLQTNSENVVAVHCKAGKGRTGVMLCAYMVYARTWRTAHGALEFYAAARSMKQQGVTILSQQRFVRYFAEMCRRSESTEDVELLGSYEDESAQESARSLSDYHAQWLQETQVLSPRDVIELTPRPPAQPVLPARVHLLLIGVILCGVAGHKRTNASAADWRVRVECGAIRPRKAVYDLPGSFQRERRPCTTGKADEEVVELELCCNRVLVWDEVKVELRRRAGGALGNFWFHTAFVEQVDDHFELTLTKSEIDKVAKDAKHGHKKFAPEFAVRLRFEAATPQDTAKLPSDA